MLKNLKCVFCFLGNYFFFIFSDFSVCCFVIFFLFLLIYLYLILSCFHFSSSSFVQMYYTSSQYILSNKISKLVKITLLILTLVLKLNSLLEFDVNSKFNRPCLINIACKNKMFWCHFLEFCFHINFHDIQ